MKVFVMRIGHDVDTVTVANGATVEDAINASRFDRSGHQVTFNGGTVSLTHTLSDGDMITLVPKVEGGSRFGDVRITRLGEDAVWAPLTRGTNTVGSALSQTSFNLSGCTLYLNGKECSTGTRVSAGDSITVSPRVSGGDQ